MSRCKNCHRKGFTVETDNNGLCAACAPYYYLTLPDDLKALKQALLSLDRAGKAAAASARLEIAQESLGRLRPYAKAGLVELPEPLERLDQHLSELATQLEAD